MPVLRNRYLVPLLTVAAFALALHAPGEISIDTGRQLHEAATGLSMSWNPPFMSAWLRLLGGGMLATTLFILINTLTTYVSFALLNCNLGKGRHLSKWRITVSIFLVLNPLFFYYVGIVWKDVLIATFLISCVTLLIVGVECSGGKRLILLFGALLLASLLPLIRQQGALVAPFFVVIAACFLSKSDAASKKRKFVSFLSLIIASVVFSLAIGHVVHETIRGNNDTDYSRGFASVMLYDITGITVEANARGQKLPIFISESLKENMIKDYTPERVDPLVNNKIIRSYIDPLPIGALARQWADIVYHYPADYIAHRARVMSRLLGFVNLQQCVPIYDGKYVLAEDASTADGQVSFDERARLLSRIELKMVDTPIFRNWFYVLLLGIASCMMFKVRRKELRWIGIASLGAGWVYFLSLVPTAIACDVRYLYPVAILSTVSALICINGVGGDKSEPDSLKSEP